MGIERVVTIVCDYEGCKGGKKGPTVLQWNETRVSAGAEEAPEASKYLILSSHNGTPKTFCSQVCAASYFLPPAYDLVRSRIETLPVQVVGQGPVAQADGAGPEDACKCGHPWSMHNTWGCTWVLSKAPGDYCQCTEQEPKEGA